jgi:RHS repeat-associated protein
MGYRYGHQYCNSLRDRLQAQAPTRLLPRTLITPTPTTPATWHGGAGERLSFVVSNYDAVTTTAALPAAPLYRAPTGVFSVLTTVEHSSGTPTSVLLKDPDGTSRLFSRYESTGVLRLDTLMDRYGSQVTHARDGQGRLTRVEDTHGRYIDLTYDAQGMVAGLSDSGGRVTTYAYDAQGRKTGESGPTGTLAYEYDAQGRMTKITYPDGGVKNYAYDAQGRIAAEDDGSGRHRLAYAYHPSSTVVTDALGRREVHEFVSRQGWKKPSRVVDAHGGVTRYEYDAAYNLAAVTDPLGRVTRYSYDAQGNATTIVDPAGGIARAAYEPVYARPTRLVDPLGRGLDLDYDSVGNLTQATDALSQSTRKQYDAQGHLTRDENALGQATLFSYEPSNGALKTVSDPLSRQTVMLTDPLSRVTRNTDPAGKAADYEYDAAGNLTKVTDALGGVTEYGYAPGRENKRLSTVKDAKNQTTSFGYDAQGRLTSVVNALNQARSSAYDLKGNLIQTTNARGQSISYAYDALDRLKTKTAPEGVTSYQYDAAGNLTKVTSYNGSVIELSYDALNRVSQSKQTLPNGHRVTLGYSYDAAGNRTGMSTPWGSFSYAYDALNRLTSLTNPQGRTFTFEYDAAGRRTALNYPNGVRAVYSYDAAGQLLGIIHTRTSDSAIVAKSTYSYDAAGNRTSMTDLVGTHGYGYDDLHRLISASHPSASGLGAESFTYDAVGNRLADHRIGGYTYDAANRLVENSSYTYTYDADGNRTSKQDKLSAQTTTYAFNSENQLVGLTRPNGESWTYKYDRPGRRVEKSSGTSPSQTQRFVHDGDNLLAVLDGDNTALQVFTMGLNIDEPLSMRNAMGTERFFHADALGNVLTHTSTAASLLKDYNYSAHGVQSASAALSDGDLLMYAARIFDSESDLYDYRRRHYDPTTGAFISEDPIGFSGGLNRHTYVENNPTNFNDPSGLYGTNDCSYYKRRCEESGGDY